MQANGVSSAAWHWLVLAVLCWTLNLYACFEIRVFYFVPQVSLETEGEWVEVRRRMESWKAPFIWTSGHICDK